MEKFLYDNIVKIAIVITLPLWTAFALAEDIDKVITIAIFTILSYRNFSMIYFSCSD